jgi:hypothetical protein
MSDDELAILLESKRDAIESDLLDALTTKRRNLYVTDVGFFGVTGRIAKRHSVKRLAIDGKQSYGGEDERTEGICHRFVISIFDELINSGKIVTGKTKSGTGYRTAKQDKRAKIAKSA